MADHNNPSGDAATPLFAEFPPTSTEEWEAAIERDLKGGDYERMLVWDPMEPFRVRPYYRADDLDDLGHLQTAPGQFPYLRGTQTADNDWRVRQDITTPDLDEAHRQARLALDRGATALGFVVDARGGVLYGVLVQRQDDLARLLDDVPLDDVPIHLAGQHTPLPLLAMLLNEAERRGTDLAALRGTVAYDPFSVWVRSGTGSTAQRLDDAAQIATELSRHAPHVRALGIDLQPYHEAGASTVQEIALALATASEYLAQCTERGCSVETICSQLHLIVPIGSSYFLEIAKLRALRWLMAQVLDAYDLDQEDAALPPIQVITSRWNMTVYDPHTNMLRATTEAAAAVIGGCDTLVVRPYTDPLDTPDDFAYRIARNTQLILKHESHVHRVVDPAAGSYYIEQLTDKIAQAAWSLFQEIESQGGLSETLRTGFVQDALAETRSQRDEAIAKGKRTFVGTNAYPDLDETRLDDVETATPSAPLTRTDNAVAYDPAKPLSSLRDAFGRGAALGDVLAALETDAEDRIDPLPSTRGAEPFETLRLRTERYARAHDHTPSVFLLPIGHRSWRSARANFARNFFGCAGFRIHEHLGFDTVADGVDAALDREADVVVLCSSDKEYATYAPDLCQRLSDANAEALVVVAGYPNDDIDALRDAGVDDFIHRKQNLLETLQTYQRRLGVVD